MELIWIGTTIVALAGASPVWQGLVGGVVITLMSTIGALLVLVWRRPSERFLDAALGFAAGVMLTASFTSLILPGIEHGGIWPVLIGIAAGALVLDLADHVMPHLHAIMGPEGRATPRLAAYVLQPIDPTPP